MKKLLIHVGILFLNFFLFGCIDQNDYVNKSNEEIKNGLYLIIKQKEYPTQNEFSVSEIWSETSKGEKDFYITTMGLLSKNVISENDHITILFEKNSQSSRSDVSKRICVEFLSDLSEQNVLYGFNLNSNDIIERKNELKNPEWIDKVCTSYTFSSKYDQLYIKFNTKNFSNKKLNNTNEE